MSLASHGSERLRLAHSQLEGCLKNGTDPPAWLLDLVMRTGSTSNSEASKFDREWESSSDAF